MEKPKVLYISDSLGTPIHPRGIFNYSVALVEIFRDLGFDVTLLVEGVRAYNISGSFADDLKRYSSEALRAAQVAEVYRYFLERHFHFNWEYKTKYWRLIVKRAPALARQIQRWLIAASPGLIVDNNLERMDFIPSKGEHLALMNAFMVLPFVYSGSMTRAVNGLEPYPVKTSGYDLVVVDTPHYVSLPSVDPSRVFTVVHDLIPLRDPTMSADWRRLFIKKMEATLALDANMIFVSETTRDIFHKHFPSHKLRSEHILYPSLRRSLVRAAERTSPHQGYLQKLYAKRNKEYSTTTHEGSARTEKNTNAALISTSLPYFVTAVSDEPRKNIPLLVEAFAQLRDKANMVIIGQIDESRYLKGSREDHSNIIFTGYVSEEEKSELIRDAAGMIFPSFAEGFGIPIAEGAVLGVPVLCSDIPVFREIVGDMATLFDPRDSQSLVQAVENTLRDPTKLSEQTSRLRNLVSTRFSQKSMASRLADALRDNGFLQ